MAKNLIDEINGAFPAAKEAAQPASSGNSSVSAFARDVAPIAERVGAAIGVDPSILIGQWGIETRWGKSVIPGTHNYGNIKDFRGSGVSARDNMNGSVDKYRAFSTPEEFADHYAGLVTRKYRGALDSGSDPKAFAAALKGGGYAEDPNYVTKIASATEMVRKATGGKSAPGIYPARDAYIGQTEKVKERTALLDAADESPVSTSLGRGLEGLKHNAGLFLDNVTDDSQGAAERIKAKRQWDEQNPAPRSSQGFVEDWQRLAEDDYAGMFATFAKNPGGALNQMVEQTPNSLPALAIQIPVGIASSALYATGVGAPIAMGLQAVASFVGNVLTEGGAVIEERLAKSGINPNDTAAVAKWIAENRGANLEAGIKKAGGISLVDGATGYLAGKLIAGPSIRFAQAEAQVLAKAGVNTTDKAAIAAARATPAYKQAMAAPAKDLLDATTRAQKVVRKVGGFSLEAAGEGVGEYAGSYAANGEASVKDAILEGAMGAGTSAAMTGANMALGAVKGPDMDRAALEALAATPQPTIKPNSPLSNAAGIAQAAQANAAQPDTQASADQLAQGSRPATGGDIGNPLDALLATRDSLNARINGLNNLLSESDPGTPEFQEIRNRAQQATAERDSVMRQIDAASAFGAMNPSANPRPQDSDPLASRVEAVRSFVEDKDLIRALRGDKLRYGPESVNELLSAWARARNPNTSPEIRNRALDDISAFINTFNSRPNFTFGQNREQPPNVPGQQVATINPQGGAVAPATPRDDGRTLNGEIITRPDTMAGANPNQLAVPPVLGLPTEEALAAKRQADADYDQAFQDLVKAEQLGATEAELAEYQRTLTEAERLRSDLAAQIADTDTRVSDAQRREAEARRREILARVIEDGISGVNPVADVSVRFSDELRRQGYRNADPTEAETQSILRAVDVANAREDGPLPSLPNEGDFYKPPKPPRAAAPKAEAQPRQQPARKLTPLEIRKYIAAGAVLSGDTLTLPDGTTIRLKGPQIAAAREAIRKAAPQQMESAPVEASDFAASEQEVVPQEVETADAASANEPSRSADEPVAEDLAGEKIDSEWTAFAPETGTLGIPRDQMPQIKAGHRGAMTNFMNARGVDHRAEEVPADFLKPTQAEFSPGKVKKAMEYEGGDRSILVSNDDYVLDGHHQWLAKREAGEPIKVIRLDAPIAQLVPLALEFPSSTTAGDAAPVQPEVTKAAEPAPTGLNTAIKILMDRTDGNGSPDGLIGPENADARIAIVAALAGKTPEEVAADPAAKLKTAVAQVERRLYDAAGIQGESIAARRSAFLDWLDGREGQKAGRTLEDEGNQEPVKSEAPASARVSGESATADQEAIKNPEPDPLDFTPKQFHEARMAWVVKEYDLSPSEVRQDYDTDAARAADESAWVDAVRQAFKDGKDLTRATLDKLEEVRPGAFLSFLHDYPDAKVPESYQTPAGRKTEKAADDAKREDRAAAAASLDAESIFTGLAARGLAKTRAKQAAQSHPQAEQIAYVQENFHDILIQLMDAGKLEVNGSSTVTEDNKSCL